jgi:hypothetical protein
LIKQVHQFFGYLPAKGEEDRFLETLFPGKLHRSAKPMHFLCAAFVCLYVIVCIQLHAGDLSICRPGNSMRA